MEDRLSALAEEDLDSLFAGLSAVCAVYAGLEAYTGIDLSSFVWVADSRDETGMGHCSSAVIVGTDLGMRFCW